MLIDVELSHVFGREGGELLRVEVVVGVFGVQRSERDTDSTMEADSSGGEKAMGNPLSMQVLHTLLRIVMYIN